MNWYRREKYQMNWYRRGENPNELVQGAGQMALKGGGLGRVVLFWGRGA